MYRSCDSWLTKRTHVVYGVLKMFADCFLAFIASREQQLTHNLLDPNLPLSGSSLSLYLSLPPSSPPPPSLSLLLHFQIHLFVYDHGSHSRQ